MGWTPGRALQARWSRAANPLAVGLRLAPHSAVLPRADDRGFVAAVAGVATKMRAVALVPTVAEEARRTSADLVVIGRGSVSEPFGRLRTHAFGIIQRDGSHAVTRNVE